MRNKIVSSLDESLDLLASLEETEKKRTKHGSEIILERRYYEDDCLSDYKEKPYKLFVFVANFVLRQTKKGRVLIDKKRDVIEIQGKSLKEVRGKLDNLVNSCYGELPAEGCDSVKWIPDDMKSMKESLKLQQKL